MLPREGREGSCRLMAWLRGHTAANLACKGAAQKLVQPSAQPYQTGHSPVYRAQGHGDGSVRRTASAP